jgi:hypothetical protein
MWSQFSTAVKSNKWNDVLVYGNQILADVPWQRQIFNSRCRDVVAKCRHARKELGPARKPRVPGWLGWIGVAIVFMLGASLITVLCLRTAEWVLLAFVLIVLLPTAAAIGGVVDFMLKNVEGSVRERLERQARTWGLLVGSLVLGVLLGLILVCWGRRNELIGPSAADLTPTARPTNTVDSTSHNLAASTTTTPSSTPTPTPTETPTYTPTPTGTATPTVTPVPTLTPTHTLTPIIIPTPTPAAPILTYPENGYEFPKGPVVLRWEWSKELKDDEWFSVRAWDESCWDEGKGSPCFHESKKVKEHSGGLAGCREGKVYWHVAFVRKIGDNSWEEIAQSEVGWFIFHPVEPIPPPPPTHVVPTRVTPNWTPPSGK